MTMIPTEPGPVPTPGPGRDIPPLGNPTPPIREPEPERRPDEAPVPNPDENDNPAKQAGDMNR